MFLSYMERLNITARSYGKLLAKSVSEACYVEQGILAEMFLELCPALASWDDHFKAAMLLVLSSTVASLTSDQIHGHFLKSLRDIARQSILTWCDTPRFGTSALTGFLATLCCMVGLLEFRSEWNGGRRRRARVARRCSTLHPRFHDVLARKGQANSIVQCEGVVAFIAGQVRGMLGHEPFKSHRLIYHVQGDLDRNQNNYIGNTQAILKSQKNLSGACIRWSQHQRLLFMHWRGRPLGKHARTRYNKTTPQFE